MHFLKFSLVLNLFFFLSVLCVSCRSSRTGALSVKENISTVSLQGYERTIDREELINTLSIKRDSLHIRIIEYYPIEKGDTAAHGSIRSETEIRYSATDTTTKIIASNESIHETDSTTVKQETNKSTHQETKTSSRPWFDSWEFYLTAAIVIIIIVYIIIRRFT